MARGGYRKPNNPAPVSGPGALSRRTDGGVGSKQAMKEIRTGKYGESKAVAEQQAGAPMAGNPVPTPQVSAPSAPAAPAAGPKVNPLFDQTARPSEPVTAGMPFGAGSVAEPLVPTLNANSPEAFKLAYALQPLLEYDATGRVRSLYDLAVKHGW